MCNFIRRLLFCRIKNFVISWGSALFFLYFFYPISFLHTVGSIKNGLTDNVSVDVFNVRNVFLFFGLLACLYCFFKKDIKIKVAFLKIFGIYAGLLIIMFLYSYFNHVFMPTEIVPFLCVFLPSTFFSAFLAEETFMKMNKILSWGLLIFFCFWQMQGRLFISDYLGFLTLLLLSIVYTLTKGSRMFYLLYILFNVYIFFQLEKRISGGVGQMFVIYTSVFGFLLYKKYYGKFVFCLCCALLTFFFNRNYEFFYRVVIHKMNVRLMLIENKPIENKLLLKKLLLITPYNGGLVSGKNPNEYYRYPHNSFIEAYMVFGVLGIVWYLIVNVLSFLGLKKTKYKNFFILMFLVLTLLSLKQGTILSQKLLILFHVFGLKMFFLSKVYANKPC